MSALELTKEMLYAAEATSYWPSMIKGFEFDMNRHFQNFEHFKDFFSVYVNATVNEKALTFIQNFMGYDENTWFLETPEKDREWNNCFTKLNKELTDHEKELKKLFPHFARVSRPFKLKTAGTKVGVPLETLYTSAHHAVYQLTYDICKVVELVEWSVPGDSTYLDRIGHEQDLELISSNYLRINDIKLQHHLEYERLRLIAEYGYPKEYDPEEIKTYSKPDLDLSIQVYKFHPASAQIPPLYTDEEGPIGPLSGNGKDLAHAILKAKDKRPLLTWNASGAGFVREVSKQKLEAYFQNRTLFEKAKQRLAKLKTT